MDTTNVSFPFTFSADPIWLAEAFKVVGNTDQVDRVTCQQIADESGMKLPRWLMKDPTRRVARGIYAVPELLLYAAKQKETFECVRSKKKPKIKIL